jgi:hypothetical protein
MEDVYGFISSKGKNKLLTNLKISADELQKVRKYPHGIALQAPSQVFKVAKCNILNPNF